MYVVSKIQTSVSRTIDGEFRLFKFIPGYEVEMPDSLGSELIKTFPDIYEDAGMPELLPIPIEDNDLPDVPKQVVPKIDKTERLRKMKKKLIFVTRWLLVVPCFTLGWFVARLLFGLTSGWGYGEERLRWASDIPFSGFYDYAFGTVYYIALNVASTWMSITAALNVAPSGRKKIIWLVIALSFAVVVYQGYLVWWLFANAPANTRPFSGALPLLYKPFIEMVTIFTVLFLMLKYNEESFDYIDNWL